MYVIFGGFFYQGQTRDISEKKGREKEYEPTNTGRTLPDVDYLGAPF